jgi:hypothetical protein
MGLSPLEILFWVKTPFSQEPQRDLKEIGDLILRQQIHALGSTVSKINDWVRGRDSLLA